MKTKLVRSSLLGLACLSALALASCQGPSSTPASAVKCDSSTPTSAVSCDKCNTVYFKAPSTTSAPGGKGFVTLLPASRMECSECETKVITWVKTGSLTQQVCKTCGGTLHCCTQR